MTDLDWHSWRRAGVGGSDIAALAGLSNYASPFSLWAEKVGLTEPGPTTERQRIGQVLEEALATLFHERTGLYVVGAQEWRVHPEYPELRCTVDGYAAADAADKPGPDNPRLGTVQFKTDARRPWDEIPANIRAQCVYEMGVTGLRHCWLPVMHANFRFEIYEIPWDADAADDWEWMADLARSFWHEHVLPQIPPDVDGHDATTEALTAMWPPRLPDLDGYLREPVAASDDDLALVAELEHVKAAIGAAEKRKAELSNRIRDLLGDATDLAHGTDARGRPRIVASWRPQTRKASTKVVPEATYRVLRTHLNTKGSTP